MEPKYSVEEVKANAAAPEERILEMLVAIANELAELNLRTWNLGEILKK